MITTYRWALVIYIACMVILGGWLWASGNVMSPVCHAQINGMHYLTEPMLACEQRKLADYEEEFLPEIVRYNGKRVKIIENYKTGCIFSDAVFTLTVIDKKINAEVGSAKRLDDNSFSGYVVCGNHELDISGDSFRALARSAYYGILESEKY